jgi:hypothetical protein
MRWTVEGVQVGLNLVDLSFSRSVPLHSLQHCYVPLRHPLCLPLICKIEKELGKRQCCKLLKKNNLKVKRFGRNWWVCV